MTQEEKQLLLKDLCARLPYGIKIGFKDSVLILKPRQYDISTGQLFADQIYPESSLHTTYGYFIHNYRPYLRPMSSLTEEERRYLLEELGFDEDLENGELSDFGSYIYRSVNVLPLFDWLIAHHFDYRGLIPMGLALEAPEEMYNLNEK